MDVSTALQDKNVQAFLAMIRRFESANDYTVLYGGSHFSDDSAHPDVHIQFHNPLRSTPGNNDWSTAAGAYQINYPTWLGIQSVAYLPDFTPSSQDAAAVWLLKLHGVLPDIVAGNFSSAVQKASATWASLPGNSAGQRPRDYQVALNAYTNFGGSIA